MSRMSLRPHPSRMFVWFPLILLALGSVSAPLSAQDKPPITVDDYGPWKRISSVALSPDGGWMSYAYDRLEGEDTLYVRA
ncbi:hypothetical protein ACFL5A_03705, partial [Gemmatimonadota bacterium]